MKPAINRSLCVQRRILRFVRFALLLLGGAAFITAAARTLSATHREASVSHVRPAAKSTSGHGRGSRSRKGPDANPPDPSLSPWGGTFNTSNVHVTVTCVMIVRSMRRRARSPWTVLFSAPTTLRSQVRFDAQRVPRQR
jgi:hypothetical protein